MKITILLAPRDYADTQVEKITDIYVPDGQCIVFNESESCNEFRVINQNSVSDIKKLFEQHTKLLACVKFYADKLTYQRESDRDWAHRIIIDDLDKVPGYGEYVGGKLARQCLKDLEIK